MKASNYCKSNVSKSIARRSFLSKKDQQKDIHLVTISLHAVALCSYFSCSTRHAVLTFILPNECSIIPYGKVPFTFSKVMELNFIHSIFVEMINICCTMVVAVANISSESNEAFPKHCVKGPSITTYAPRGRVGGSSLLYISIAYYMQKGGRGSR